MNCQTLQNLSSLPLNQNQYTKVFGGRLTKIEIALITPRCMTYVHLITFYLNQFSYHFNSNPLYQVDITLIKSNKKLQCSAQFVFPCSRYRFKKEKFCTHRVMNFETVDLKNNASAVLKKHDILRSICFKVTLNSLA